MTRRDAVVLAAAVALGLMLGLFAVTNHSAVERVRQWLQGSPQVGTQAATVQVELEAAEAELQELAVERARLLIQHGRDAEALRGLRDQIRKFGLEPHTLVGVEALAFRLRLEPEAVASEWRERTLTWPMGAFDTTKIEHLLAHTPEGLGDPEHAGHEHAAAFVTAALLTSDAPAVHREIAEVLAELVGDDADRLVGVLSAWAALADVLPEESPVLRDGRVRRDALVQFCQALLDRGHVDDGFCDALAAHARVRGSPRSRAVAAMALAELADLPIGLGWSLPISDADAENAPRRFIADEWLHVRNLDGEAAFAARVARGLDEHRARRTQSHPRERPPGVTNYHGGAHVWLAAHVSPSSPQTGDWDTARRVASGELSPVVALRALAGGAASTSEILAVMEEQRDLRLPLHHLLVLTGAAGDRDPPRRAASSQSHGIVQAWRDALALSNVPWTVRVARVERTLDGPSIVAEALRTVRVGSPAVVGWKDSIPDDDSPNPGWTTPGSLTPPIPRAQVSEDLELALSWGENGAVLKAVQIDFRIRHASGGGSSGTSGSSWPAKLPIAVAPWGDAHEISSRRAFLIIAQPGTATGEQWTIDDWRAAAAAAFERIEGRVPPPPRSFGPDRHGLWMLGHTLALLRPEIDIDRLEELNRRKQGLGMGVASALAFGGKRVLVRDTAGGLPTPSQGALSLPARDIAELAIHAPDVEVRAAMCWLLTSEKPPPKPVAEELLAISARDDGRVPIEVIAAANGSLATARAQSSAEANAGIAGILWMVTLLLTALAFVRFREPHGARGGAALLLGASLVLAQVTTVWDGLIITPAWAGWGLAAFACWMVGRGRAERESWACILAFGIAALVGAGAHLFGLSAEVLSAAAAVAGCLLIAPLAPALVDGLVAPGESDVPRKPSRGTGWSLFVRAGLGALFAAAIIGAGLSEGLDQAVTVGLFYIPFALCFGGIVMWRLALARDASAARFPTPFVVGLVTPATILLVTELATRVTDGPSRELDDPLGPMLRVSITCALLFIVLRTLDAGRVRGRADQDAARLAT